MKTAPEKQSTTTRGQGVATAIVAACAFGMGVTGTRLWVQSRPAPPVSVAALPASAAISGATNPQTPSTQTPSTQTPSTQTPSTQTPSPPADLTSGMTPPQKALTLGNWYYDHDRWDLAIQNYRAAIAGGLDNPNVRTDLGNALRFSNQPQRALEQYQFAQKQDPNHEQSLFNQGALYAASMNNPKKGIEMWQAYLNRFPNGASVEAARSLMAQAQNAS